MLDLISHAFKIILILNQSFICNTFAILHNSRGYYRGINHGITSEIETNVRTGARHTLGVDADNLIKGRKYVIASSPSSAQIVWNHLGSSKEDGAYPLVETGLQTPLGIAVDNSRQYLYVADYGNEKIYRYALSVDKDRNLKAGPVKTIAKNVKANAVTTDNYGHIFFTTDFSIGMVDVGHPEYPKIIYTANGTSVPQLSGTPSGIATDGVFIYWSNLASGTTYGSVNRLPVIAPWYTLTQSPVINPVTRPPATPGLKILSKQTSASGVCLAGNLVYFPEVSSNYLRLYQGRKKSVFTDNGGYPFTKVSEANYINPHHCTWDKDSSLLVVFNDGVFSFAGALTRMKAGAVSDNIGSALSGGQVTTTFSGSTIGSGVTPPQTSFARSLERVMSVSGAHGVAVFNSPSEYEQFSHTKDLDWWARLMLFGIAFLVFCAIFLMITKVWREEDALHKEEPEDVARS